MNVNEFRAFRSFMEGDSAVVQVSSAPASLPTRRDLREPQVAGGMSLVFAFIGALLFIWLVNSLLCICKPNEILVISGNERKTRSGQKIGYRVIFGGRAWRIPILETVRRMDMTTMPVPVEVRNAYAKGGTPLNIQAIANVKVSSNPSVVGNAIERFLDRDRKEIVRVARETLEGNLRGVVALLTPEDLNEDRLQFAERIAKDVSRDLSKLGLQLDTLKIQSVADDLDYLNSIGRRQIALVVRDAEIAESDAVGEAERIEADCLREAEVAKTKAKTAIQQRQNELRTIKAELEQQARSEEERTSAAAQEARARAEQVLQAARAELERLRLEADEVLPAEAQRQAKALQAKGDAAVLEENARAAAMANNLLSAVWQETGVDASEIFLIQQIEMVLQEAAQLSNRIHLNRINLIDNGDGQSLSGLVNAYPEVIRQFLGQVNQTLGIDVMGTLNSHNGASQNGASNGAKGGEN